MEGRVALTRDVSGNLLVVVAPCDAEFDVVIMYPSTAEGDFPPRAGAWVRESAVGGLSTFGIPKPSRASGWKAVEFWSERQPPQGQFVLQGGRIDGDHLD
jgi:hypothetical protein